MCPLPLNLKPYHLFSQWVPSRCVLTLDIPAHFRDSLEKCLSRLGGEFPCFGNGDSHKNAMLLQTTLPLQIEWEPVVAQFQQYHGRFAEPDIRGPPQLPSACLYLFNK